jgi:ELWxxDGT repeat protein
VSLTYFVKNNAGSQELWVSDGTVAGTQLVKSLGAAAITRLEVIGARAFLAAEDAAHGKELWISAGTAAGTVLVDDINPGATGSFPSGLTNIDGTLFFSANDGVHGEELWKSDGTASGTVMIDDVRPGPATSIPSFLTAVNGTLFFSADDVVHGRELWKSDGTAAGTVLVKDIAPGASNSFPAGLVNVNGAVFFAANDGATGNELWKSDGTTAGTVLVKDINLGSGDSNPSDFVNVNGMLFFSAFDSLDGDELWKSDGTIAGTVMVKDIRPGAALSSSPGFLTNVDGTVFFGADDGVHGFELWKSDGTSTGTVMVKDIDPGPSPSNPGPMVNVNGTLFFQAFDSVHGLELWKSDGTDAGTVLVKDINPGSGDSNPDSLTSVNGVLEFYAFDGQSEGLFRSDGTAAGTIELATNVDTFNRIGFAPSPLPGDFNNDGVSDVLWRNVNGTLAGWSVSEGRISSSEVLTFDGAVARPDASWSVAGISDFNGDGAADVLWRNVDGTLVDWTMNGSTIASGGVLNAGGAAIMPDASWSVAGVGDFDGDSRSDILWRDSNGTLVDWAMNGSSILSNSLITAGGNAVTPDASWGVAGIGDFDGDGRADILWRNTSGEVAAWLMNGSAISIGGDVTSGGAAIRPDASWSIAGVGDFNHDGKADILWRNANGSLAMWLMNGTTISSSGSITFNGAVVAPDASWHVVEIGDFNGDSDADILWRNDNGALAEWLMNGNAIGQAITPTSNGATVSPDGSWSTQAKPTISA